MQNPLAATLQLQTSTAATLYSKQNPGFTSSTALVVLQIVKPAVKALHFPGQ